MFFCIKVLRSFTPLIAAMLEDHIKHKRLSFGKLKSFCPLLHHGCCEITTYWKAKKFPRNFLAFCWFCVVQNKSYNHSKKMRQLEHCRVKMSNKLIFLGQTCIWGYIYPQQPVTVGSNPDLLVICIFTTTSAQVGWMPTVEDKLSYVRPHLENNTNNKWSVFAPIKGTFGIASSD